MSTTSKPTETIAPQIPPTDPYPSPSRAWYVVAVLMVIYVLSFIDRQILSLMVGPMKRDLEISDTQMGLLTGFTFALFYTICGFPLGRLADTKSRRGIIAVGLVAWSIFTTACGLARNYTQLLVMRMGVGVGEATLSPSAYSMLTDYFPPHRRSVAISAYSMGIYIGSGLAYILGGYVIGWASQQEQLVLPIVGETRPWQLVFFIVGLPGILLSLLLLTIREPVRRGNLPVVGADGKSRMSHVPVDEVLAFFKKNWKTLTCHTVGFSLLSLASNANGAWIPEIFRRLHGWKPAQIGLVFGLIVAIACTLGIVTAGWLADKWIRRGRRDAAMRLTIIAAILGMPTGIAFNMLSASSVCAVGSLPVGVFEMLPYGFLIKMVYDGTLAALLLIPGSFFGAMPFGIAPAAIQQITPNRMRGQASALYLFVVNLIGMGLGATSVGFVTDYIFRNEMKLNYSLLSVVVTSVVLGTVLLALGLKPFRESDRELQELTGGHH